LPDAVLLARLTELYGPIPPVLLEEPAMRELVLRITRADLRCLDGYRHRPERPLSCPVTAFGGSLDQTVTQSELDAWRVCSDGPFSATLFDGGHFFVREQLTVLGRAVKSALSDGAQPRIGG
jgi:surfactin synthase thioesterase subunit